MDSKKNNDNSSIQYMHTNMVINNIQYNITT